MVKSRAAAIRFCGGSYEESVAQSGYAGLYHMCKRSDKKNFDDRKLGGGFFNKSIDPFKDFPTDPEVLRSLRPVLPAL